MEITVPAESNSTTPYLVVGADGQLGKALRELYGADATVEFAGRAGLNLTGEASFAERNWKNYSTIINAAAYPAVDTAESAEGRAAAWAINVTAVSRLARTAVEHDLTLVHVSSDYVFDGSHESHAEDELFTPLGVCGQTKAAADAVVSVVPRQYIVRTSWFIGEANNFVRTMASLVDRGIEPSVVNDQIGRLSFTADIAAGIRQLLESRATYGTYNFSNEGEPQSWADIAADVYELSGRPRSAITGVSTEEYFKGKEAAPRPLNSVLKLGKIKASGSTPREAGEALRAYLAVPQTANA